MDKATLDTEVKDGKPTVDPDPNQAPQPDPAVAELQRKVEELSKQTADKDKYITDLKATMDTLETRLTQREPKAEPLNVDTQVEAQRILEKAQLDPESAGRELAALIKKTTDTAQASVLKNIQDNLQPAIENNVYAAEVKTKHKELLDFFGEDFLSVKVAHKLQTSKISFKEAVDTTIKEYQNKMDTLKTKAPPAPTPKAAEAEGGSNKQPEPAPVKKEETQEDELARRAADRAKKGL